jgi:L-alanine-DL-glutamate epimerase-like enolase superfamily enzyme
MKITDVKVEKICVKLVKPFRIALGTIDSNESVIVKIHTDEGIIGIGEGSPEPKVTGETFETVFSVCGLLGETIKGLDPIDIEKINHVMDKTIVGNPAAKAAIDIALHDILGKVSKQPLYKLLGGYDNSLETDFTIGIDHPDVMAQEAVKMKEQGFRILKIKVGLGLAEDIQRIKMIREAVGSDVKIRVDANQGWTPREAIRAINAIEEFDIDAVEQPVPYWDIDSLAQVKNHVNVPIMADESVFSPQDALEVIKRSAVDIINIKLMKCGGLFKAARINAIAEAAGVECMLGCMLENVVSITAAASFVAAHKNVTRADLDSTLMLKEGLLKGGALFKGGIITLPEAPGLAIEF